MKTINLESSLIAAVAAILCAPQITINKPFAESVSPEIVVGIAIQLTREARKQCGQCPSCGEEDGSYSRGCPDAATVSNAAK